MTFPATRTTLSTGPRAGDPTAHTGTRSLLAMSYQLRPGRDTGPRWLVSCPLGPGYVLHCSVSSPVPQLSAPSVHTLVRGNRGHLPPGGLITLTLLVRLLAASRCENGGNRSREVGFRPSCPWSLLAGGGQRGMRPEATGAQPSLFTHLWSGPGAPGHREEKTPKSRPYPSAGKLPLQTALLGAGSRGQGRGAARLLSALESPPSPWSSHRMGALTHTT